MACISVGRRASSQKSKNEKRFSNFQHQTAIICLSLFACMRIGFLFCASNQQIPPAMAANNAELGSETAFVDPWPCFNVFNSDCKSALVTAASPFKFQSAAFP
jgi:hypothetical protein